MIQASHTRNENTSRAVFRRFKTLVKVVIVVEVVWLVVVNGLLHLPLTQGVINSIRPEKFSIRWERAWSWYPGRVWLAGAAANGASRRQMWQVEVDSVSGSIALLPLLLKRVWISDVNGVNVDYRQRPRPRPEHDYSRLEPFFPVIEGREVEPALPLAQKRWPWRVSIDDLQVGGQLTYWIYQVRGEAVGSGRVDLEYKGGGGPLELDVRDADLALGPHWINDDRQVFPSAQVSGRFGFVPFRPRDNRGWPMLEYTLADLDVDVEIDSLRFINAFLLDFEDIAVNGRGRVLGRLRFAEGEVLAGTDLAIAATDLRVEVPGHSIGGQGDVVLAAGPEADGGLALVFNYGALQVTQQGFEQPMLTGDSLVLRVGGDPHVLPRNHAIDDKREIAVEIGQLAIPDLSLYQRYLPAKWPLTLEGGTGTLKGMASMTRQGYHAELTLHSDGAQLASADYRFDSRLEAKLNIDNASVLEGGARLDSSFIHLSDARLRRDGLNTPESWSARLDIGRADYHLLNPEYKRTHAANIDLFAVLRERNLSELLDESHGRIEFDAHVSSLGWLAVFLGKAYRASAEGSARIEGVAELARGLPAPGTDVLLTSKQLGFNLLDYTAQGEGAIQLSVLEGGDASDWRFAARLWDAGMRRRAETDFFMRDVTMSLEALLDDVRLADETPRNYSLDFRIPTARLVDMAVFNMHLPPDAPLRFGGGEASLEAELQLHPQDASGWLRLAGDGVGLEGPAQSLRANLAADISVVGGVPVEMAFDITGSRLRLDRVQVVGGKQAFADEAWDATLVLDSGHTVFKQPMQLELEATLTASDSRPLVALFQNQPGWRPDFLAHAMTVEDIEGKGRLHLHDRRLVVSEAWLSSDNIRAGIKGVMEPGGNDGRIYLQYRDLGLLLKLLDGEKNLDIFRPRSKYDDYRVPE